MQDTKQDAIDGNEVREALKVRGPMSPIEMGQTRNMLAVYKATVRQMVQ